MHRKTIVKAVLWSLVGVAAVIAFVRFTKGLGAVSAMTDTTPWGIWIAFDVMAGVALAAGGFVVAATVYIFKLERYRPIVRPAVLTAFLGYGAVIAGLMFDLGMPWRIWHATVYWQHHSPLFEVAWCVMLYFHVLALEFAPVVLEHAWFQHPTFQRIYRILKKATIPLVIAGIVLSTLHQSSLGSLFLIMPFRLHALWYSPILPLLFFLSAISVGLMMVTLESLLSSWLFRHPVRTELLAGLGRAASYVLWLYIVVRFVDLAHRGSLSLLVSGSWQSYLFFFEIGVSALIPALLLSSPQLRNRVPILALCSTMTVFGMVLNRLDVGLIAIARVPGMEYIPSWMEIAISLGVVSGATLVFIFCAEHFRLFEGEHEEETAADEDLVKPLFTASSQTWLGDRFQAGFKVNSLCFVLSAAVTASILPTKAVADFERPPTPVHPATGWETLSIDGNRMHEYVIFPHKRHEELLAERLGEREGCMKCHHMSKPKDGPTSCWECHADMYLPSSIFDHDGHREWLGDNASCVQCHPANQSKSAETAKPCRDCHEEMFREVDPDEEVETFARSYVNAMHDLCVTCHEEEKDKPTHAQCSTCHTESARPSLEPMSTENVDLRVPYQWHPQPMPEM